MAAGDLWLVGATPDDIYRSTDGGVTWDSSGIGAPAGQTVVTGIAVAPNGDLWLAGNVPDDIYRSTDEGATWDSSGIGAPAGQTVVQGIAVAPNGDLWLVGTTPNDIYRSTDGGVTWDSSGIGAPAAQLVVRGISVAPNGDLWLVGSAPNDIYRSTDEGVTWDSSGIGAPAGQTSSLGIAVAPNGDLWLAGNVPDDIYRSTDEGATWDSSGIGAPAGQTVVTGIAFDPRLAPSWTDNTGDAQNWTEDTAIATVTVPAVDAGSPAPTYAATSVPTGISFDTTTLEVSGTPTVAGSGTITITATNSGGSDTYTIAYTVAANTAPPTFSDGTGDNAQWVVGDTIQTITVPVADGTPVPTYSVVSIPSGISLNASNRQITGTPITAEGSGTVRIRATNSEGTADWTFSYQTLRELDGYEQIIPIPATLITTNTGSQKRWRLNGADAVELAAPFSPVGETRYLRRIIARNNITGVDLQFRLFFADSITANPPDTGDALNTEWEEYDLAVTFEQGTDRAVVSGPAHADNEVSDATEPYSWSPVRFEQQIAEQFFFSELDTFSDWTLTLRIPLDPLSVDHTFNGDLDGTLSATATLGDTPLVLSDFTVPAGHRTVFAALIEIGVSGVDRYRPDSSIGSLLDGDLNVTSDIDITRIRIQSEPRVTFNRTGAGDFQTYLELGGNLNDATIYLQSADGLSSVDVIDIPDSAILTNQVRINNTTNADMVQRLEDRVAGDRLIVAMTEPLAALSVDHTFSGDLDGTLSATATLGDAPELTIIEQVVVLSAPDTVTNNAIQWDNLTTLLDPAFVESSPAYLRVLWLTTSQNFLYIHENDQGGNFTGAASNPQLVSEAEEYTSFMTLAAGGQSVTMGGPASSDASVADDTEPYQWQYNTDAETRLTNWLIFYQGLPNNTSVTLTLRVPGEPIDPSEALTTSHTFAGALSGDLSATASVGDAPVLTSSQTFDGDLDGTLSAIATLGTAPALTTTHNFSGALSGDLLATATLDALALTAAHSFSGALSGDLSATAALGDVPTSAPSWADNTGNAFTGTVGTAITPISVPSADGNPEPTYTAVGSLPAGIIFIGLLQTISGTPTAAGSGTITIRATNIVGTADWTVDYAFAHPPEPNFADDTGDSVEWFVGIEITPFTVPAATGTPTPTYAAVAGTLPGGIGFDPLTRQVSGTPTTVSAGTLRIRATNSAGTDDWQRNYTIIDPLVLANSDDAGLEVDAKALLVASAAGTTSTNFFYGDTDSGGTDTPLDGELGLGADDVLISRFRRRRNDILQLNDADNPTALDIGAYFDTGGAGNDLTIYLQTLNDGEVSFPVAGNVAFTRDGQVRFDLPSDAQTLLDNLASGDRWIFKTARPSTAPESLQVSHSFSGVFAGTILAVAALGSAPALTDTHSFSGALSGDLSATATLGGTPALSTSHTLSGALSGDLTATATLGDVPVLTTPHSFSGALSGDLSATATLGDAPELTTVHTFAGALSGDLSATATLGGGSVVIPLPEHTYVGDNVSRPGWSFPSGSRPDLSALSALNVAAFGVRIGLNSIGAMDFRVGANQTGGGGQAGPELSDAWESYNDAITFIVPGLNDLVMGGPDDPANGAVRDSTEPYEWFPTVNARYGTQSLSNWVIDFVAAYDLDNTLRAALKLDDGGINPVITDQSFDGGLIGLLSAVATLSQASALTTTHNFTGALSGDLTAIATLGDAPALTTPHSFSGALSGDLTATAMLGDAPALSTTHSFSGTLSGDLSAIATLGAGALIFELPDYTTPGNDTNLIRFLFPEGSRPDISALSADPSGLTLFTFLQFRRGAPGDSTDLTMDQVQFQTSPDQTTSANQAGPDLSDAFEQFNSAIVVSVPGLSDLVVGGPNDPANSGTATTQDDTEPYIWHPGTNARYGASEQISEWIIDFESAYLSDNSIRATIRLDDGGISPLLTSPTLSGALSGDLSATATLGTPLAATVIHTFDGGLDGSISINAAVGGAPAISTPHNFSGELSGDLSATATLGAGAVVFELPEPTHFTDGTNNRLAWNYAAGSRPDWSALSALGEPAFGGAFNIEEDLGRIRLFIAPDQTTGIFVEGPELSDAFESYNRAIIVTVPGLDDFVIGGPNDPANDGAGIPQDPIEPYVWFPGTNARYGESGSLTDWVTDFVTAYGLDSTLRATLRLDDGGIDPLSTSPTLAGALSGDLSATATLGDAPELDPGEQVVVLPAPDTVADNAIQWNNLTTLLNSAFVESSPAYLRVLWLNTSQSFLYIHENDQGGNFTGAASNPQLVSEAEEYASFITLTAGGQSVTLGGPASSDVAVVDDAEPYQWPYRTDAKIRLADWLALYQELPDGTSVTLTLRLPGEPADPLTNTHNFTGDLDGTLSATSRLGVGSVLFGLPEHTYGASTDAIRFTFASGSLPDISVLAADPTAPIVLLKRVQIQRGYNQNPGDARGDSVRIQINPDQTGSNNSAGPDLSDAWETFNDALTVSVPGLPDIVMGGPNDPLNDGNIGVNAQDNTDPYRWYPGTNARYYPSGEQISQWALDFIAAYTADSTLRATVKFNDGGINPLTSVHTFGGELDGSISVNASVGNVSSLTTPYTFDGELVGTLSATATLSTAITVTASFYVSGAARTVYQNGAARSVYRDGTLYVDAA